MNNIVIGTAGHVDHGKTCLIQALTGVDTDRLKEEKQRGITIELGFADFSCPNGGHVSIIDVPGHEKFIRNMLSGTGGIDAALFVVAADEGIMPQTLEHFEILKTLGIQRGIIAVTKADSADREWTDAVEAEIGEMTKGSFLEDSPVIEVSVRTGQNIEELKSQLCRLTAETIKRDTDPSLFRMSVDRVFTMEGFGTVVTGTLGEGSVKDGDEAEIYPSGMRARVRNIQVHGKNVSEAFAGQRTALNIANIKKTEIRKGDVAAFPGSMQNTRLLDVYINMFSSSSRVLTSGSRVHLHYGSAETICRVILMEKDSLAAEESGYAQLRIEEEIAVKRGDRFIIRFFSPVISIGGGVVIDPHPLRHKRKDPEALDIMKIKNHGKEDLFIEEIIKEESTFSPDIRQINLRSGGTAEKTAAAVGRLAEKHTVTDLGKGRYVHRDYLTAAGQTSADILEEYHLRNRISQGMPEGEFREKLSSALHIKTPASAEMLFRALILEKKVAEENHMVTVPGFRAEYTREESQMQEEIIRKIEAAGFEAPDIGSIAAGYVEKDTFMQMIENLRARGILIKLDSRHYINKKFWDKAISYVETYINEHGQITLAEMRDLIKSSRKYTVMILEAMDQQKITQLTEGKRILRRS